MNIYAVLQILAETEPEGDCLLWTGRALPAGYGHEYILGKRVYVHRKMYEECVGPIPKGAHIDHRCHRPACVRPEHLRPSTVSENGQNRKGAASHSKTGIRGVFYSSMYREKWTAQVVVRGKQYRERFATIEEAADRVVEMRRELLPYSQDKD